MRATLRPYNTAIQEEVVGEAKPGTTLTFPSKGLRLLQCKLVSLLGWAYEGIFVPLLCSFVCAALEKPRHALFFYHQALEMRLRIFGPFHVDNLQIYEGLARVYVQLDRPKEAVSMVCYVAVSIHHLFDADGKGNGIYSEASSIKR